jgi:hypothetical protein
MKEVTMDPLSMIAIALTTGATAALKPTAEQAIKDAYAGLKALIQRKFGASSEVAKAVDGVETKPDSQGRQTTLKEELTAANVAQDQDILQAAQRLLDLVKAQPDGAAHIQQITGNYNVQADRGSTVNYNAPPKKD